MTLQLWLLLLMFAAQIPRPAGPPPRAAAGVRTSISGTVINAGSNAPVRGAQVLIRQTGATTVTDGAGTFTFFVTPGRYTLAVQREGQVLQEDPRNGLTPSGRLVTVNPGIKVENIVLPMIAAPTIAGYTYNISGEPLAGAAVNAYRWRFTPQGPRLRIVRTALTNDLGEYRLFWLGFGDYLVSATYSRRAQRSALAGVRLSANLTDPDDGYATVFYGGGSSASQARTVRVAPGFDTGTLNILFSDVPRFKIRGRLVSAGALPSGIQMVFVPEGSDVILDNNSFSVSVGSNGTFEITGVSPGSYVILAYGSGASSDVVPITVTNEDIERLSIPLSPTAFVTGRVASDFGSLSMQSMKVMLVRSSNEIEQEIEGYTAADGTFTIPEVGPGEYDVFVERLPAGDYIRTIRVGGRDVLSSGLRPNSDTRLEISLSSMAATLDGRVMDRAGEPLPGAQVVLVPEPGFRRRTDRYIVGFSDASGSFQLTGIPPGRYTAYAFEQIEPGAYYAFAYNPPLTQRFADRAASINVNEVKTTSIELKVIPVAETAGGFR
jgi:hypothetical protein